MYFMKRKFSGLLLNKSVDNIIEKNIFKWIFYELIPYHLHVWKGVGRINPLVSNIDTRFFDLSSNMLVVHVYGLWGFFCKYQYALILPNIDISKKLLLECCGTKREGLLAIFHVSMSNEYFEDIKEKHDSGMEKRNNFYEY